MSVNFYVLLYIIYIYHLECYGITFIDLPGFGSEEKDVVPPNRRMNGGLVSKSENGWMSDGSDSDKREQTKEQQFASRYRDKTQLGIQEGYMTDVFVNEDRQAYPPVRSTDYRRHWLVSAAESSTAAAQFQDEKDDNIKSKINLLVQQATRDADSKMKSVQKMKERHSNDSPYRVGFILSMIKKSRDVLNELFNVAVKHRDEWRALEQLKIFELIVHTNVDTSNLVRQLVQIHMHHLNQTALEVEQDSGDQIATENPEDTKPTASRRRLRKGYGNPQYPPDRSGYAMPLL